MVNPRSPLAVLTLGLLVSACGEGARVIEGECQSVFEANVCTWATASGDDVVEFGATIPLSTVENAPLEGEMVFPPVVNAVIPLPDLVARTTGFNHLSVYWERHGHPPALFSVPHFDFHFYTTAPAPVAAIDCGDSSKPERLPDGHALPDIDMPGLGVLVGLCVPGMGMHTMLEAELDETEPFGASMLVGYYGRELTFLEPMVARSKLLEAQSFQIDIPAVPDAGADVRWPTRFEAVYDEETRAYRLTFSGLPSE